MPQYPRCVYLRFDAVTFVSRNADKSVLVCRFPEGRHQVINGRISGAVEADTVRTRVAFYAYNLLTSTLAL